MVDETPANHPTFSPKLNRFAMTFGGCPATGRPPAVASQTEAALPELRRAGPSLDAPHALRPLRRTIRKRRHRNRLRRGVGPAESADLSVARALLKLATVRRRLLPPRPKKTLVRPHASPPESPARRMSDERPPSNIARPDRLAAGRAVDRRAGRPHAAVAGRPVRVAGGRRGAGGGGGGTQRHPPPTRAGA